VLKGMGEREKEDGRMSFFLMEGKRSILLHDRSQDYSW